ncbi:glutamate receptor 2.5-like [Carica papaya]|uniref:glutamate receptor 2.5-like n=1 Tax=Carica papaya TaxID=3649 RepID=UPI000B8CAB1A|nr:glutamate receptor 2.5-like [Carica papaya]
MSGVRWWFLLLFLLSLQPKADQAKQRDELDGCSWCSKNNTIENVGGVIRYAGTRVGKEQKIAMKIAIKAFYRSNLSDYLRLKFADPLGTPASAASAAIQLIGRNHVQVIIGTITMLEAALIYNLDSTTEDIPIISLTSLPTTPHLMPNPSPLFLQFSNDVSIHMQCLAAIVGNFKWRKVTTIYQQQDGLSIDSGLLILLSDSLRKVDSEIDTHLTFPPLSLSDPKNIAIERELKKLKSKSNRIFIILRSSLEFAILLFEKAKQMQMVEKDYVWIITDEVTSLLESIESSILYNMQGILGFKTSFIDSTRSYREFKTKFRKKYELKYPKEEYLNPSIFALRAYDAMWAVAKAKEKSHDSGIQMIDPKGWSCNDRDTRLKIGIPTKSAFYQFVSVSQDKNENRSTHATGFSIQVFEAVVNRLSYHLSYDFVPSNDSYDDIIQQVSQKVLDGAIGDISIISDRYQHVEFSQPYMESRVVMALLFG